MKMNIKERIAQRISESGDFVFLPREFLDLGSRDQVIRALRQLCDDGKLLRVGIGLYAKARRSSLSGEIITTRSPSDVLRRVFDKLGRDWRESQSVFDYNAGTSTQIPVNPIPSVAGFRRKIAINGRVMDYRAKSNPNAVQPTVDELIDRMKRRLKREPAGWEFSSGTFQRYTDNWGLLFRAIQRLRYEKFIVNVDVRPGFYARRPAAAKPAAKAPSRRKADAA